MPVIAHIMLALVYVTASAIGAAALIHYDVIKDAVLAPWIAGGVGVSSALIMMQLHMALSRLGGTSALADQLFQLNGEMRRLSARVVQAEAHSAELKESF